MARNILEARDRYVQYSVDVKAEVSQKIADKTMTPMAGMYYSEYVSAFDRIVRHATSIALVESQPNFWIKRKKLQQVAKEAPEVEVPELVDSDEDE